MTRAVLFAQVELHSLRFGEAGQLGDVVAECGPAVRAVAGGEAGGRRGSLCERAALVHP